MNYKTIQRYLIKGEKVSAYDNNTKDIVWSGRVLDCNYKTNFASILRDDKKIGAGIDDSWFVVCKVSKYWDLQDDDYKGYLIETDKIITNWKTEF